MRSLFYQKNLLFYLLIALTTFFVWHKILNQTFLGEGYYYFNSKIYLTNTAEWKRHGLWEYDNFAKIFFQILVPIFKDNIQLYQLTALIITTILLITFYKILSNITKDKFLSFTATIFLSTNYYALFEYLAAGNYQRFIQRIPNLIPTAISFYFLWKFLETKKINFLIISLCLYSLGILMGHFSSMLLPLFLIYPFIEILREKIDLRNLTMRVVICVAFAAITLLLTKNGDQKPAYGFSQFFQVEQNIPERVLYQTPLITFPTDSMEFVRKLLSPVLPNTYAETYRLFLIPSLILYLGGAFLVSKKLPKLFLLYLTFLFSMVSIMFLYMYVDPRLNVLGSFGEDRYFLPSLLFAVILWAMIIRALFLESKKKYLAASIILLIFFALYNTNKIWWHIESIQYKSEMMNGFINYFRENRNNFKEGSIFVAPSYLSWPGSLITEIILKDKSSQFVVESRLWNKDIWSQKETVYVFDYDYKNRKLIDLTGKYRSGEKVELLN